LTVCGACSLVSCFCCGHSACNFASKQTNVKFTD
jgi:hypothetical protein